MSEQLTITELYHKTHSLYNRVINSNDINAAQQQVNECIQLYAQMLKQIDQNGLFSSNETLDDISTNTLKYVLISYYCSNLLLNYTRCTAEQYALRIQYIVHAIQQITKFVTLLQHYDLINQADLKQYKQYLQCYHTVIQSKRSDETDTNSHSQTHTNINMNDIMLKLNGNISRDDKIKQYKYEKQLTEQLTVIEQKRAAVQRISTDDNTVDLEYDEYEREYIFLQIQQCILKTLNDMKYGVQELVMLCNRNELESLNSLDDDIAQLTITNNNQTNNTTTIGESAINTPLSAATVSATGGNRLAQANFSSNAPKVYQIGSSNDLNKSIPAHMQQFMQHVQSPTAPQSQTNIQQSQSNIVQQNAVNQAMIQQMQSHTNNNIVRSAEHATQHRQNILATAFIDRNPATVTPEQWAEQQIQSGALPAAPIQDKLTDSKYVNQSYNNVTDVLSEDDHDLNDHEHDRKQYEAREWDNWKDDHERGAGARKLKQGYH